MELCIATVCVSGDLREKLEAIAAAGFKGVEIFENDLIAWPGSPREIRKIADDLGLKIATCQPFRDFEGLPLPKRQKAFDRAERKFDLLQDLGSDLMFVCSSVAPDADAGIGRIAEDFHMLGERAAKRRMKVAYEALAFGRWIFDYRDSWEVVRRADHPSVGLALDSFHVLARKLEISTLARIPGDRIFFVQMADAPQLDMDYLTWARHWRCLPGQGDLDLTGFAAALGRTGYDGWLSLEIFNDRFRAGSAREVALDGRRSLLWLLDETERQAPGALARSAAPAMPPPAPIQGVAFIEFTVDPKDRDGFERLLAAIGFVETGRHRSKDVSLWEQGDIRFVVNAHREGFAQSYRVAHGLSVCAMALKVPDARAAIARAEALLDTPHHGAAGPDELDIPAVRGVGGSLLYFVDDGSELGRWSEVDFEATGKRSGGLGLRSVDHVSQTMQYGEMLTWLLFYASLIDCRKLPSQTVLDPRGVVQSQVIESGLDDVEGGLRLAMNGSQSHQTQSARFVTDFFGSGVQHIALASSDLRRTVAALVAAGVEMLPVPANYYEDLKAKGDLSPAVIDELRKLNILYDHDGHGPFLQAYAATLEGGFFFEFVERTTYKGYGAPNAGIRLAAQARLARPATMPST
jgi:4-hydroxyphenylpyruvate dioxygenase